MFKNDRLYKKADPDGIKTESFSSLRQLEHEYHFFTIKNMNAYLNMRRFSCSSNKKRINNHYCETCLLRFRSKTKKDSHRQYCQNDKQTIVYPNEGDTINYQNQKNAFKAPVIGFADFECFMEKNKQERVKKCKKCDKNPISCQCDISASVEQCKDRACAYSVCFVDSENVVFYQETYSGEDAVERFLEKLEYYEQLVAERKQRFKKVSQIVASPEEWLTYRQSQERAAALDRRNGQGIRGGTTGPGKHDDAPASSAGCGDRHGGGRVRRGGGGSPAATSKRGWTLGAVGVLQQEVCALRRRGTARSIASCLAVYLGVRHFRHYLEGRDFPIFTDHRPLTFAMGKSSEPWSHRQARHLEYISQYSTDIRHVSGVDNAVADALSRAAIEEVRLGVDFIRMAELQQRDPETKAYRTAVTALRWSEIDLDGNHKLLCDTSQGAPRPLVPAEMRREVFDLVHGLSHPGTNATVKVMKSRFVWHGLAKDVRDWARGCIACQAAKVHRHNKAPMHKFEKPTARFAHVHVDLVGPLPLSQGC